MTHLKQFPTPNRLGGDMGRTVIMSRRAIQPGIVFSKMRIRPSPPGGRGVRSRGLSPLLGLRLPRLPSH